jgi:hypothetical protein
MNSKIFDWEFKQKGIFLGYAYEWKKQYVEIVHLPKITSANKKIVNQIEILVNKISSKEKQNNEFNKVEYENQINQLVYKMYELSSEEINFIESIYEKR